MAKEISLRKKLKKIYFLGFIFAASLIIASARLQIVESAKFEEIQKNKIYSSEINSVRGAIYARDGTTLSYSEVTFDMYIWMDDLLFFEDKGFQTREEFLAKVSPIIDSTSEKLQETIDNYYVKNNTKWFLIAKGLSSEKWEQLTNLKTERNQKRLLGGFTFEVSTQRKYPEGALASQVIGLTKNYKDQVIGQSGLESYWDGVLNPIKGYVIQEDNAVGEVISTALLPTIEPKNGSSVYTSIDKKLQQMIEEKVKWSVENFEAKSGTIVVMDPKTGQIMALANYPTFDPNVRETDATKFGNIAVSSPYEIGSVGKVFTLSAALDLGVVTPDTVVLPNGHQGCEKIHRDLLPVCTWDKKPQPPMSVADCFIKSDNLCFYHLAEMLDKMDMFNYLRDFGVGTPTGVDLTGESIGNLKNYTQWNTGDVSAYSYGHGYLMNAIQATAGTAAIPNKGVRMKPYFVTKVEDSDGTIREYKPEQVERVIEEQTANTMIDIMRRGFAASIGSYEYYYHDLLNYDIGVKSGTALIADSTGYSNDINATYVGFDASPERKFIMLVRLERPQKPAGDLLAYYNVRLAWIETFAAIKDYLAVPRK